MRVKGLIGEMAGAVGVAVSKCHANTISSIIIFFSGQSEGVGVLVLGLIMKHDIGHRGGSQIDGRERGMIEGGRQDEGW